MKRQIIQFLLENQGFVSYTTISSVLQQPLSIVKSEIRELDRQFPQLLHIKLNYDSEDATLIKVADYQDKLAKSFL